MGRLELWWAERLLGAIAGEASTGTEHQERSNATHTLSILTTHFTSLPFTAPAACDSTQAIA